MSIRVDETCQLCGKNDGKVEMYVGGYLSYAHPSCAEIGDKAIEAYLHSLLGNFNGLWILASELVKMQENQDLSMRVKEAQSHEQRNES